MKKDLILFFYKTTVIIILLSSLFLDFIVCGDYTWKNYYDNMSLNSIERLLIYFIIFIIFIKLDKLCYNKYSSTIKQLNLLFIIISILRFFNTTQNLFKITDDDFQIYSFFVMTIFIVTKMFLIKKINNNIMSN